MTAPKTARTTKVPGRISVAERRQIDAAIAGQLDQRMTRAWFAFAMRRWDEREEMLEWRQKPA